MYIKNKICGFLLQNTYGYPYSSKIVCLIMKKKFLKLLPLGNPKSHDDSKPTKIQNSNPECSMIRPYFKCLVHPKPCNHPTPLTLPPLYFGFHPQNPCEMTENEMKALCYLLSICLLHNSLCSFDLLGNQRFYTQFWFCNFNLLH